MASLNKVLLIGNLGADPEMRYLPSGDAVTIIRVATTDRSKDKGTGESKEFTEWHRVVFFGRLAEIAGEYLKKGSLVYIEGRIRTRKWQDQSGQDRYSTEIIGSQMVILTPRSGAGGGSSPMEGGHSRELERPGNRASTSADHSHSNSPVNHPNPPNSPNPSLSGTGMEHMDDDIPF